MDLKFFFKQIPDSVAKYADQKGAVGREILINNREMPDYAKADVAIIGIPEDSEAEDTLKGRSEIRKEFYQLKRSSSKIEIVDLGDIQFGASLEETYLRIKEVCEFLIDIGILPILIGGSHDMDYGQFMAYEGLDKMINMVNVDAYVDLAEGIEDPPPHTHIHQILLHEPNYLLHYAQLGYQSYLNDPKLLKVLEMLNFEAHRLGSMRNNFKEVEPIIRDADLLSFDVSSINGNMFPAVESPQPFGLSPEEASQICWYAGLNEKLSSFGIYGYVPTNDNEMSGSAKIISVMIWYFLEGFAKRSGSVNFKSNDFLKYVVAMPVQPERLIFYKSKLNEKWWMEIPKASGLAKYTRKRVVPCSYEDYNIACKGELPDRWIQVMGRL